jgi:DNA-binding NarL/FixJ family response regulator
MSPPKKAKLPTMSLRAAPEYHKILRDIGLALRTRPELVGVLQDVLQSQHTGIAPGNTDVLQRILERLANEEEFSRRIMAFAENINDRLKAVEHSAAPRNTAGNTDVLQPKTRLKLRLSADQHRKILELRAQGMSREGIAREMDISTGTVSNYWKKPLPPD